MNLDTKIYRKCKIHGVCPDIEMKICLSDNIPQNIVDNFVNLRKLHSFMKCFIADVCNFLVQL